MNPFVSEDYELKHSFNEITNLRDKLAILSDGLVTENMTWNIAIGAHYNQENEKFLAVYFCLTKLQPIIQNFVCEVNAKFEVWKNDQIIRTHEPLFNICFQNVENKWGFPKFAKWQHLMDNWILDGKLTIGVKFSYKFYNFDFNRNVFQSYPVKFGDGRRVFINKQFFAMFSQHLMEEFKNSPKFFEIEDEAEATNINDFCLLYAAIHPNPIQITGETFVKLLDLSKRFEVENLFEKCVKDGVTSTMIPMIEKFRGAELIEPDNRLMKGCLELFKTPHDIKIFALNPDFEKLQDKTRLAILMALVKIIP